MPRDEFLAFAREKPADLLSLVGEREGAIVVKQFLTSSQVEDFRARLRALRAATPAQWHPCLDGCPDYHRINDEYPGSYVRGQLRVYYFHRWNENRDLFEPLKSIFEIKNLVGNRAPDAHYDSLPSTGVVSRIAVNHFPRGGGYLEEHVDPTSEFARLQTILQGTTRGREYREGGLYYRASGGGDRLWLDPHSEAGDLLVLSPAVSHGVAPIDPSAALDWDAEDGRLTIIPIIMYSDYHSDPAKKSKPTGRQGSDEKR